MLEWTLHGKNQLIFLFKCFAYNTELRSGEKSTWIKQKPKQMNDKQTKQPCQIKYFPWFKFWEHLKSCRGKVSDIANYRYRDL